ncbi:FAD-dependent oxidoreductase [Halosimplex rubrum]|uniref:FAD-dependent oxidoreductase n=1 Tax=Halosimplex rubrum TaxID=869889 RepID=A0A7D5T3L3_9EURY|nr:FAD-dependent oxidoreductase [Halosimplex rubrum]QLH76990.1 FAD-dependent oxidoreductase [Halosimplex rubrum]
MGERIEDVTVVGGGDSGLLAALALARTNPGLDVSVVDDFDRPIPKVGKSTFLAIQQILHDSLGIDEQRFVEAVKPVWKASVYFRDWCGCEPFHYPFDQRRKFPNPEERDTGEAYYFYYAELADSDDHLSKCEQLVAQGKSPWYFEPREGGARKYENVAYHLDTERFNAFLRELCLDRGISLVDDEIVTVDTDGDRIRRLRGRDGAYEADLYVDASGFSRALRSEQDATFREFDLPLDAALNARSGIDLSEVVPATVIDTGEAGWFWQIDTYDSRDRGYVYASEYLSEREAREEFLDHCEGIDAEDVVNYEFSSGYHERAWIENCVAVGNAAGFVEPLQSTGLTANAKASVTLATLLSGHGGVATDAVRERYNAWVERTWESVYDFVSVHYAFADGDTQFWESVRDLELSPRVDVLLEDFDRNGFDAHVDPTMGHSDVDEPLFFQPLDFYALIHNMGATSEFYETHDFEIDDETRRAVDRNYGSIRDDVADHYDHREFYHGALGQH